MPPRVSVLMSVYNGEQYLEKAIESILNQTFTDFEFIIVDDGSFDSSPSLLASYQQCDSRILIHRLDGNRGLSAALNFGIHLARGEYIARMDADDVSLPTRLQEQIFFMESHPEVDICGVWVELIGARQGERWQHPVDHNSIYARMLFDNAIVHPTVLMRVSSIVKYGIFYDEHIRCAQDYELWSRALINLKFANFGRVLLNYRVHAQGTSVKYRAEQILVHDAVYRRLLESLQIRPSAHELALHQNIATMQHETSLSFLYNSYIWLKKISRANCRERIIPPSILDAELNMWWRRVCSHVFFQPSASSRLIFGVFRFPMGKIKKISYRLACLIQPGVNSK